MTTQQLRTWGLGVVLAWGLLGNSAAQAQGWELLISQDPVKLPDAKMTSIPLRPNVQQAVYLFVKNDTNNPEEVVVRLLKFGPDGKTTQPLAEVPLQVPNGKTLPVSFAKPEEAKPKEAKSEEAKPKEAKPGKAPAPPDLLPLDGPPFRLRAEVVKKGEENSLTTLNLPVSLLEPKEYLDVSPPQFTLEQDGRNTLTIEVKTKKEFTGPECTVELVLSPELIDGLVPGRNDGRFTAKLQRKEQTVQLLARNLRFRGGAGPRDGVIYLTVDGFERAFIFRTAFSRPETKVTAEQRSRSVTDPALRVPADGGASKPAPKVALRLEVDNPPAADVRLEVIVDRDKDGKFVAAKDDLLNLPSARRQKVSVGMAGPKGGILFGTEVRDWETELDTTGLFGEINLQIRMLDRAGTAVQLISGRSDGKPAGAVTAQFVIDDTPPEDVRFASAEEFPRRLVRGAALPVKAIGTDLESRIREVVFFVGKPAVNKEGQQEVPATAEKIPGERMAGPDPAWWAAELPLPSGSKGVLDITALFVNGAGQGTYKTIKIELVEPGAAGAAGAADAAKKYKVEGKVVEGNAPQPGIDVFLRDDKGAVKASAKTNDGKKDAKLVGTYKFENVAPGSYTVTASKVASMTTGAEPVTVENSDVKDVEVKLYR